MSISTAPVVSPNRKLTYLENELREIIAEAVSTLHLWIGKTSIPYEEVKISLRIKTNSGLSNHIIHITSVIFQDKTPIQTLLYVSADSRVCIDIYTSTYSDTAVLIAATIGEGWVEEKIVSSSITLSGK